MKCFISKIEFELVVYEVHIKGRKLATFQLLDDAFELCRLRKGAWINKVTTQTIKAGRRS